MTSRLRRQKAVDGLLTSYELPLDKAKAIMSFLRSGQLYVSSNLRNDLLNEFKEQVALLDAEETTDLQALIIDDFDDFLHDRIERRIAYNTIFKLIEFASQKNKNLVLEFERFILANAVARKKNSIDYIYGLAGIETRILGETSSLLFDFVLTKYIHPWKSFIDFGRLHSFAASVGEYQKQMLLLHMVQSKPFWRDEAIIGSYIRCFPDDLEKVALLI
jgi:hypothetical protein